MNAMSMEEGGHVEAMKVGTVQLSFGGVNNAAGCEPLPNALSAAEHTGFYDHNVLTRLRKLARDRQPASFNVGRPVPRADVPVHGHGSGYRLY
jgi:hypothetical protein